jgi:hypothetical protein
VGFSMYLVLVPEFVVVSFGGQIVVLGKTEDQDPVLKR